jgi:predicted dehydrogenase
VQDAEIPLVQGNHFALEMDHFSSCILNNLEPRTPGAEGLADMRVIAAIEKSIHSGGIVKVA